MHQSIPNAPRPPSPRAAAGHLPVLSVPGVGHSQIYCVLGAGHLPTPGTTPKNLSMFLKACFLNFNKYFNLKRHNFKANSESVYKLSRFAIGRI